MHSEHISCTLEIVVLQLTDETAETADERTEEKALPEGLVVSHHLDVCNLASGEFGSVGRSFLRRTAIS